MDPARINALLSPFLAMPLAPTQLEAFATYLDLLLRWNARLNLTAVRDAESIVKRHYGESLFAASRLLSTNDSLRAIDVGSGPGFPGLPMKIFCPGLRLTLIESQHKKVTFLREVIRALHLEETDVYAGRAQDFPDPGQADLVTMRAVERFDEILPVAVSLLGKGEVAPGSRPAASAGDARGPGVGEGGGDASSTGCPILSEAKGGGVSPRLGLLIGASQVDAAHHLAPNFHWNEPVSIPQSSARIVLIGSLEP
jgi:16S rRNA (guanine527-N7)-methyltransferase